MRVWVTRAAPGGEATAARLRALGHDPLTAPLTATAPLAARLPDPTGVAALAFTSAAGVRAFTDLVGADPEPWRALPVFAVGGATAAAARAAGWKRVQDADGDGAALAAALAVAPPAGPVLAPGAREPAFDLTAALSPQGVAVRTLPVYATEAMAPPPAAALAALRAGALDAVLLHAPSAARALDAAVPAPPPGLLAACLSDACRPAAPGWRVVVAAAPREADLLRLLDAPPRLDSPPASR